MTRKLVFWTAFNSYQSVRCLRDKSAGTIHPVRTMGWTARRAEIWRKFTLNSLFNQSHADFLYVVLLDPALRHLTESALPANPDPRGNRVIYAYEDEPALTALRQFDEIVFALIDNDDMYARDAGKMMMDCPAEWMYFKFGYCLELRTGLMWKYDVIKSGPFFAHRFDPKKMISFDREKRHPTHKAVIGLNPTQLPPGQFCVTIHNVNTSSTVGMRYVLRNKPVSQRILKDQFGR